MRSALEIVQAIKELRDGRAARRAHRRRHRPCGGGRALGPVSAAGLAVGETPNLAAGFQSMAEVNEIVIAHETRSLVGETFELTDLGALPLDGIRAAAGLARRSRTSSRRTFRRRPRRRAAHRAGGAYGRSGATAARVASGSGRGRASGVDWRRSWHRQVAADRGAARETSRRTAHHLALPVLAIPPDVALYPVIAQIELAAGFAREDTAEQKLDKLEAILVGREQRAESAPLLAALLSLPTERYAPLGLSAQKQKEKTLDVLRRPGRSTLAESARS